MAYGNCGGDNTSWEVLGDQSGKEWCLSDSPRDENSKWIALFRYPNPRVQAFIANQSIAACLNDNCGYSQSHRQTFWDEFQKNGFDASKISVPCGSDCSASSSAFAKAAGIVFNIPELANINKGNSTKTLEADFIKCGFQVFHDADHTRNSANRVPGDILLSSGHATVWVFNGAKKDIPEYIDVSSINMETDLKSKFMSEAEKRIGDDPTWSRHQLNIPPNTGWSGAFVSAVAMVTNCMGKLFPETYIVGDIAKKGVESGMGTWIPASTESVNPQVGDIAFFVNNKRETSNPYDSDYCGIIRNVTVGKFDIIFGNVAVGRVDVKTFNLTDSRFVGIYAPNWDRYNTGLRGRNGTYGVVYSAELRREDATIRGVGYLSVGSDTYKYTKNRTNIKLGVINYTSMLSDLLVANGAVELEEGEHYSSMTASVVTNYSVLDTSICSDASAVVVSDNIKASPQARQCITFLQMKGFNSAISCGIAASIYHASNFNTSMSITYDNKTIGHGICRWSGARFDKMKTYVGSDWKTNYSKQLEFMYSELSTDYYKDIFASVNWAQDTESNCLKSVNKFLKFFDIVKGLDSQKMQATAKSFYDQIVTKQGVSANQIQQTTKASSLLARMF